MGSISDFLENVLLTHLAARGDTVFFAAGGLTMPMS